MMDWYAFIVSLVSFYLGSWHERRVRQSHD